MVIPYDQLVAIPANHKRVCNGWGWKKIRDHFKISAYVSQKLCGLRKSSKRI